MRQKRHFDMNLMEFPMKDEVTTFREIANWIKKDRNRKNPTVGTIHSVTLWTWGEGVTSAVVLYEDYPNSTADDKGV